MKRQITRREFIGSAAVAACAMMSLPVLSHVASRPNSNFNGVQIGTISYSFRSLPATADDILNYMVKLGLSSVELMGGPVEQFAGAPRGRRIGRPPRGTQLTDKQRAERRTAWKARAEELRKWRLSPPWDKFKALRKKYEDEGVKINIVKFEMRRMVDEEIEYCFNVAKLLGAKGITCEISDETAKKVAPFADKHKIMVGFHNHTQVNSQSFESPLSYSKYNALNLDVGHYVAGTNESPIPIIKKYSDRILSLHLKDRKINNGANMPFGKGDTPLALILQLMKREKYPFTADIEYEYRTPEGSEVLTEIAKCVEFCREALD